MGRLVNNVWHWFSVIVLCHLAFRVLSLRLHHSLSPHPILFPYQSSAMDLCFSNFLRFAFKENLLATGLSVSACSLQNKRQELFIALLPPLLCFTFKRRCVHCQLRRNCLLKKDGLFCNWWGAWKGGRVKQLFTGRITWRQTISSSPIFGLSSTHSL